MMSIGKSYFNFGLNPRANPNPIINSHTGIFLRPNPNKIPLTPEKFLVAKTVYCENLPIENLEYPKINLNCLRASDLKIQFETKLPNQNWVPGQYLPTTPFGQPNTDRWAKF